MKIIKKSLYLFITLSLFNSGYSKETYEFFKGTSTSIRNPFKLRDPFKKLRKRSNKKRVKFGEVKEGDVFTNLTSIEDTPIDKIQIVGVLIGKQRMAIAKIKGAQGVAGGTFTLKEGMKLGENNAEIKAILPGGVVLVEKIRNVYDQEEYLETILPISSSDK